jgi:hypothetical protein
LYNFQRQIYLQDSLHRKYTDGPSYCDGSSTKGYAINLGCYLKEFKTGEEKRREESTAIYINNPCGSCDPHLALGKSCAVILSPSLK